MNGHQTFGRWPLVSIPPRLTATILSGVEKIRMTASQKSGLLPDFEKNS